MEHYWQECLRLPLRIQEWDAYKEMRDAIKHYLDVFPTLHKLNSKVPWFLIRRHAKIISTYQCFRVIMTPLARQNKKNESEYLGRLELTNTFSRLFFFTPRSQRVVAILSRYRLVRYFQVWYPHVSSLHWYFRYFHRRFAIVTGFKWWV